MSSHLSILAVLLAASLPLPAAARADAARAAGFETIAMEDGSELAIWYPASGAAKPQRLGLYLQRVVTGADPVGRKLPLIVISHGSGGTYAAHHDTAVALAEAGFVVAAPLHPGDNWRDRSRATDLAGRTAWISAAIDTVFSRWSHGALVNPRKIGAMGYSAGGFAVLAAAGARPDLARIDAHCQAVPAAFECGLAGARSAPRKPWLATPDRRIRALVVAAPALGYTFAGGLDEVRIPVQLWRAGNDALLPAPHYADAVRAALPRRPEYHDVPGAGHFDFMAPCTAPGASAPICETPAFDRAAFHRGYNASITRFFQKHL